MTDIILAELNGNVWMVRGENHLDKLLSNELPDGVSIKFVACADRMAVRALWQEHAVEQSDEGSEPWLLNPAIVTRIRGGLGPARIQFGPWSAMIDAAGQQAAATASAWLRANAGGRLTLRQFLPADVQPGLADLQRLRGQLAAAALDCAGRIDHETQAGEAADIDRLDLVMVTAPQPALG